MIYKKRMTLGLLATLLCLWTLAACASPTLTSDPYKEAACAAWRNVSWHDDDTTQTIIDVKGNNAARAAFCEGLN